MKTPKTVRGAHNLSPGKLCILGEITLSQDTPRASLVGLLKPALRLDFK